MPAGSTPTLTSGGRARRTRLGGLVSVGLALAIPAAAVAAPGSGSGPRVAHPGYRQTLAAYTPRYATPVAPGVDLDGYSSAAAGRTANSNVLTVDLTHPGVSTGILSNRVTDIAPVGGWASQFGSVAAVNGDYYDIYGTSAPDGPVIRAGVLRKGTRAGQSISGLGSDGAMRTSTVYLNGTVTWGTSSGHVLDSYNSDLFGATMPANGLALLDGGWGGSALAFAHPPKKVGIVVVGGSHKVIATYPKLVAHLTVPAHGSLLVGTGVNAGIAGLKKGTPVTEAIAAGTAGVPFTWGLGAGLSLMSNGSVIHNYRDDTDPHDSRTALGWSGDGRTMYVVTVEYGGGSVGEGVNEIADEMAAAGAANAVLLDGGGSTTLVAREQGDPGNTAIGSLADGFQRRVPIGIGVFVPKGSGQVFGFKPVLDAETVFPGLHRALSYHAWDEWYGAATLDPATVSIGTDSPGLFQQSGPVITGLHPGHGHLTATAATAAPGAPGMSTGQVFVQVLDPLTSLRTPGGLRLQPATTSPLVVTGADDRGETAPVLGSDLKAAFDPSLLTVRPSPDGSLSIGARAVPEGAVTPLILTAAGVSTTISVHIGYATVPLVNPAKRGAVHVTNAATAIIAVRGGGHGLRVAPTKQTAAVIATRGIPFPAGTARLSVTAIGDGGTHALTVLYADAGGHQHRISLGTLTGNKPVRLEVAVPAVGTLIGVDVGATSAKRGGYVVVTGIAART